MVNPTIASTRSGGPIAAAYATLRHLGEDGYLRLAAATRDAVRGSPPRSPRSTDCGCSASRTSTVVAFTSDDPALDLFVLADELTARGWHTQPQLGYGGLPRSIHLTVTAAVAPQVDDVRRRPDRGGGRGPRARPGHHAPGAGPGGGRAVPGRDDPGPGPALAADLGLGGSSGGSPLPQRQALINSLLELAPVPMREALVLVLSAAAPASQLNGILSVGEIRVVDPHDGQHKTIMRVRCRTIY